MGGLEHGYGGLRHRAIQRGRGRLGCLKIGLLWLGRLGRRFPWTGGMWAEGLSGQGVILLGPGRDKRPQRSVGGEDAVVAVTVDVGWGEDFGQPIQKLQSRETRGGAAGEVGPWEEVKGLVGTTVDEVENTSMSMETV